MPKMTALLLALGTLVLGACDDPAKEQSAAARDKAVIAEARRAAEEQVRTRLRILGDLQLRAVQVYRQQLPDTFAVCGQINPTGAAGDPFIPWVASITVKDGKTARMDLVLGASNAEASRVYLESVDRCFDGGGPKTARQQAPALPPLPSDTALAQHAERPSGAPASSASNPATTSQPPLSPSAPIMPRVTPKRSVTTTAAHPVNIRSQPGGGGAVAQIVPRASVLRVFGEAPGGWVQVGEDQPFGWVHSSMLER